MSAVWSKTVCALLVCCAPLTANCQFGAGAGDPVTIPTDAFELTTARTAVTAQQWPDAHRLLQNYLLQHDNSAEAHYLLGLTLLNEHQPKESLVEYTRAAHLARPSASAFREVALDYVLLNDYPDAARWITQSVQEDGSDSESWYVLGRIQYTQNRFTEARDAFLKSLSLSPRSVKAENNLGLALEGLNQPEDAIRAYRQAIDWQKAEAHPSEQPFINLGILLTDRNQMDEALPALKKATALAPRDSRAHGALGKLYRRQDQFANAQVEFEQAVTGEPDNAGLHFQLAQVYRRQGLEAQAKAELARVAALNGTHSSVDR